MNDYLRKIAEAAVSEFAFKLARQDDKYDPIERAIQSVPLPYPDAFRTRKHGENVWILRDISNESPSYYINLGTYDVEPLYLQPVDTSVRIIELENKIDALMRQIDILKKINKKLRDNIETMIEGISEIISTHNL